MKQSKKIAHRNAIIFALIHGATYLPTVWLLKYRVFEQSVSVIIAIIPIIIFFVFILKINQIFFSNGRSETKGTIRSRSYRFFIVCNVDNAFVFVKPL